MKIATSLPGIFRRFFRRFFSFICVIVLLPFIAIARENVKEYRRDQWDLDLGGQYFYSNANHVSFGGGRSSLNDGHTYSLLDMSLETRYMPRKDRAYFAWGSVGNSDSKDEMFRRTNSVFKELGGGVDFKMFSGYVDIIPSFAFLMPLQKLDPMSDIVAANEGVMEFQSQVNIQKTFGRWLGYSWLGFTYRGDGRSFLMPWGIGAQWRSRRFDWGAELFGFNSISDDTNDSVVRENYIANVQAGSMKFYSRNPALIDTLGYGYWQLNRNWGLQANGGMTLAGSNAAAGFHVGGFIRYTFDLTEGYQQPPDAPVYIESPVPVKKSQMYEGSLKSEGELKDFKEATQDGVNQDIFKVRPKKTVRKKAPNIQKQLNKTEFQIELRRKRKGE